MLCAVYRSHKREQMYLYVEKKDDFSKVPKELMINFGQPIFVMMVNLAKRTKLAHADIMQVKTDLIERGFYLQIPPPVISLLQTEITKP